MTFTLNAADALSHVDCDGKGKVARLSKMPGWHILMAMEHTLNLSRQALDEFKAIYRDEFGEALSDEDAREMAVRLLRLFHLLKEPLPPG